MARAVIISCAITGGSDTKHMNPAVPVTPEEIANEAIQAHAAGAAIAHIHVRDPQTAKASMDPALYKEVVDRIRDSGCPILLNLTTGPGGILVVENDAPHNFRDGSHLSSAEERIQHVIENRPEMCTLDVTTMNYSDLAVTNTKAMLDRMAMLIEPLGVKIEMEVFDLDLSGVFRSIRIIVLLMTYSSFLPSIVTTSSILNPQSNLFSISFAS